MQSKFKNISEIGNRIRKHREMLNLTRPELAKAINISLSALQGWEMNEREPQASMILLIAKELGVPPSYLLTGEELSNTPSQEQKGNLASHIEAVTMIASYSAVNVSAGFGSFNEGITEPDGEEPYTDALLKKLGVQPNRCAVFWANGDSMSPTITDRDQLLVDLSKNEIKGGDKIYLVQNGESVWVKRVKMKWDGVELVSDNKEEYPPINISEEEARSLKIIGQVVHIGHSLI